MGMVLVLGDLNFEQEQEVGEFVDDQDLVQFSNTFIWQLKRCEKGDISLNKDKRGEKEGTTVNHPGGQVEPLRAERVL